MPSESCLNCKPTEYYTPISKPTGHYPTIPKTALGFTYFRGASGMSIKGNIYKIPDQVFESPKEYLDVKFTVRDTVNFKATRRAVVRPELWVDGSTSIALRIL